MIDIKIVWAFKGTINLKLVGGLRTLIFRQKYLQDFVIWKALNQDKKVFSVQGYPFYVIIFDDNASIWRNV